jgi:DNA polymerase
VSTCWLDTETRSATPISHGNDLYTADAECMIVTWALDLKPVQIWDATGMDPMPAELRWILSDESGIDLVAHNASYDRRIITRALDRPTAITRWRCTKAQAYAHGLPGSLEMLGLVLGLSAEERKMREGKGLIKLFCTPARYDVMGRAEWNTSRTHPVEWKTFCDYAVRDTEALRTIHQRMPGHNYRGENLTAWHIDQLINERGFKIDAPMAIAARKALSAAKEQQGKYSSITTSGEVQMPTQRAKLLRWLESHRVELKDMKAATVREALDSDDLEPAVRFMLELRLEAAKSSGSKYKRALVSMGAGDRVRYTLQFNGAGRTGRTSGRGFQPHNMPRPTYGVKYDQILREIQAMKQGHLDLVTDRGANHACADMMRSTIIAADGCEFTTADYSNIESRVLAWLAYEDWKLDAYRAFDGGTGKDAYKLLFAAFFGTPVDEVNDNQRQAGKVSELAFGFYGGVGALVTMSAVYNMDLDSLPELVLPRAKPEHLKKAHTNWRRAFMKGEDYELEPRTYMACDVLKQVYREANSNISKMTRAIDDATKTAVKSPGTLFSIARCKIWRQGTWLIIELPSGRRLLYSNPEILVEKEVDPETGRTTTYESVTYMSARGMQWSREKVWSGLFVENIVQAVANDVLRAAQLDVQVWAERDPIASAYLAKLGADECTPIVLHVHDELTVELPPGILSLQKLISLMTTGAQLNRPWMKGLPLAAAGWTGPRYKK